MSGHPDPAPPSPAACPLHSVGSLPPAEPGQQSPRSGPCALCHCLLPEVPRLVGQTPPSTPTHPRTFLGARVPKSPGSWWLRDPKCPGLYALGYQRDTPLPHQLPTSHCQPTSCDVPLGPAASSPQRPCLSTALSGSAGLPGWWVAGSEVKTLPSPSPSHPHPLPAGQDPAHGTPRRSTARLLCRGWHYSRGKATRLCHALLFPPAMTPRPPVHPAHSNAHRRCPAVRPSLRPATGSDPPELPGAARGRTPG